jgi:membrane protease YdiL (CAAX protease family)
MRAEPADSRRAGLGRARLGRADAAPMPAGRADAAPMASSLELVRGNARAVALVVGLGAVVTLRWAATIGGVADALLVGLAFGAGLGTVAVSGGERPRRPDAGSIAIGGGGAAVLIGLALVAHLDRVGPSLAPAAAFLPWTAVTIVVATAEEAVLRGALFSAVRRHGGVVAAIVVTSVAFALMHVPLYGWHVVPLDLGVGIFLGGLRLASGGIAAPAVAHAVADIATWWL